MAMNLVCLGVTTGLAIVVWLSGYLTGYRVGYEACRSRFLDKSREIERELAEVQRTMDAIDWLHSPDEEEAS